MAVFSNLEGTMKKSFILGKNGAKIITNGSEVAFQDYKGTGLIPVSAADPVSDNHLVTLSYLNSHQGSGSGSALRGTDDPAQSLGSDGDVYYKVDDTSILVLYIKDQGIWKPLDGAKRDSEYVTTTAVLQDEFIESGSVFTYYLPESKHQRGTDFIVQLQKQDGEIVDADIVTDTQGDITVTVSSKPTEILNVVLIGRTTLSTPYTQQINKSDWKASGTDFVLEIKQSVHQQAPGAIFIAVYQNTVDALTSTAPYSAVAVETAIDSTGNVVLKTSEEFSGKVVISGK